LAAVEILLRRYDLTLAFETDGANITGSFWGDCEAGIVGKRVFVRRDTPIHSLLHETSHIICMSRKRRDALHRDAGSDDLEEAAVCYLQVVLADCIDGVGRDRLQADMDRWGYSFRAGSTQKWFRSDASDAENFLKKYGLMDKYGAPTFRLRE
jgi:hypothetical protein